MKGYLKWEINPCFLNGAADQGAYESLIISDNKMDLISVSDFERQTSVPKATFVLAFCNTLKKNKKKNENKIFKIRKAKM